MNILDIVILAALVISVIYGMRRGFISGVLSVAALIGSAVLALMFSGRLAQWLQGNQTLVDTLIYYTDAGSRIRSVDMAMLRISQISQEMMSRIVEAANLPETFGRLFAASIASAAPA